MSESIGLQDGLLKVIIPLLKEIARHTRCTSCNTEAGGSVPLNVSIAPTSTPTNNITSAGTGSIPAGFKNITIVKTSANTDTVTITLSDSSNYVLTQQGETFIDSSSDGQILPAYTITGPGTFKWHGTK